ncbi:hypothetical protein [Streptomyces sp. NPDC059943]|uniref:hypothetical protein n=1 Tax=Streptomyces sp. NPDC059943 TaxID=3347010 RepID=UPI00365993F4
MVPLVTAPAGMCSTRTGTRPPAQRTYATAKSVELDALLVADAPGRGADAYGAPEAKARTGARTGGAANDPRLVLTLAEAFRHGKALGG